MSDPIRDRVAEVLAPLMPKPRAALEVLHQMGAGRDAMIAAMFVGRERMGFLHADDVAACVREVDAFLSEMEAHE